MDDHEDPLRSSIRSYGHWIQKTIRSIDLFGYTVNLNFEHFQPTRKTLCGGISTLLLGFIIMIIMMTSCLRIGSKDFARFDLSETQLKLSEIGKFPLKQMGIQVFFVL